MKTQHTQGVWVAAPATRAVYAEDALGYRGATICRLPRDTGELRANAHLIAAAPELLAALENLKGRAARDAEQYAPAGNEPIWSFIADAADAIKKAKG